MLKIINPVIIFGDHTKNVKYIDFDFIVGADGVKILNPIFIYPMFLYYLIEYAKINMKNRGYSRHFQFLKEKFYPIPPFNEQKRIVKKIKELLPHVNRYDYLKEELTKLNDNFPELIKKSILQEAIQGKLVPQDPSDEPASVLLDRIREEKKQLVKDKKIKRNNKESFIYKENNHFYEKIGKKGEPVCIDEEIPFEIPENWEWCRLSFIGDWRAGATPKRSNSNYWDNGTIPWLKTGDLNNDIIKSVSERITEKALNETSVRLNPVGSVLIAMYGATIGKIGILSIDSATNQACCACIPFCGIYNKYLFYFLMSQRKIFLSMSEGGAQPNISKEKIINHLIPLPPLNEQKRIVVELNKLKKYFFKLY